MEGRGENLWNTDPPVSALFKLVMDPCRSLHFNYTLQKEGNIRPRNHVAKRQGRQTLLDARACMRVPGYFNNRNWKSEVRSWKNQELIKCGIG